MENQYTNTSLFDLSITDNVKTQLKGAASWAGIAAILSLASTIISIILQFAGAGSSPKIRSTEGFNETTVAQVQIGALIVSSLISLGLTGLLFYFLYRFASLTKKGLDNNDQEMVSNGLGGLSSYFITMGVLFILGMAIGLLGIVGIVLVLASKQ
jgi:hypothetical protein